MSKDNICDSLKRFVKPRLYCHIDLSSFGFLHCDTSHCDDHGHNDGYGTYDSHIAELGHIFLPVKCRVASALSPYVKARSIVVT